jgi:hypothetical protein
MPLFQVGIDVVSWELPQQMAFQHLYVVGVVVDLQYFSWLWQSLTS